MEELKSNASQVYLRNVSSKSINEVKDQIWMDTLNLNNPRKQAERRKPKRSMIPHQLQQNFASSKEF
jgi:hypothetical protein